MSWRATAYVKGIRTGLERSEKFLLLTLADYHNDDTGRCDAAVQTLADDCLMTRRSAQLLLGSLARKGFIVIRRRATGSRRTLTNQYDLTFKETSKVPSTVGEGETITPLFREGDPPFAPEGEIAISPQGDPPFAPEGDPPFALTVNNRNGNRKEGTETRARSRGAPQSSQPSLRDAIMARTARA